MLTSAQAGNATMLTSSPAEKLASWGREAVALGIDEAGRGPVLGPMVYGCAFCRVRDMEQVKGMGFADSKVLTDTQREDLFTALQSRDDIIGWAADVISAQTLSAKMLSRSRISLNVISFDSAFGLIQQTLDKGVNLTQVFVDTVGDPEKYEERLRHRFGSSGISFKVAKKADSLFPIVSAASIVAKVIRDRCLRDAELEEAQGGEEAMDREFGSGYPGDVVTQAWLASHVDPVFGFPSLVRFSWGTCRPILQAKAALVHWDGDEEEEGPSTDGKNANARKRKKEVGFESSAPQRHGFFKTRRLQIVTTQL